MNPIKLKGPLVSTSWLADHLEADNLVVLDASLPKAGMKEDSLTDTMIRSARFMDLKNQWADQKARFPNTMLSAEEFEYAARNLGIDKNSALVVYDQHGVYSSARAWYMFRAMGHSNVAVLDGGLPAWDKQGLPLESKRPYSGQKGDFNSHPVSGFFTDFKQILKQLDDPRTVVLDARTSDRFYARGEEPREGLRSGHIPESVSLPFGELQTNGHMKEPEGLKALFSERSGSDQALTFSCGSGITACVLALGAKIIGRKAISVYDGSWTEWGSLPELPVEKD
jgi:thiosulfate/3-mercaptopyruvate sulfurtransferase